ncbi:RecB family exonuclease [Nocardia panacis]|uniref:RecB family exonuclease n=1 Tax=Nocardia panacis TaxID=2340916 RepID=A0A3A4K2J0_9NOCA|nr:RecB family exonuclease [Nocardia panacis]RJO68196.1 RecB family exonuclease [Nocardia panacis]
MSVPATTPPAEPTEGRPRPALSPSRAMDFKQCPLKYRLRAIDRIPEPPTRVQLRGTLVHTVLEELFGLPRAERLPERAAELSEPALARMLAEAPQVAELIGAEERAGFLAEVRALVETYYRLEDPTSFDAESCEARVEVESADGVLLRGFVDRIDRAPTGELRVVDYKTGRAPGLTQELKALFQLKFYALVILRTRGIVPTQLKLIYLADEVTLTYAPEEAELLRFERTLAALWAAVREAGRTGEFAPNPSWLCGYCAYRPLCPEFGGTPPPYPGWPEGGAGESEAEILAEALAE